MDNSGSKIEEVSQANKGVNTEEVVEMAREATEIFSKDVKKSLSAPSQIWGSRLSWRITLTVFVTILLVQAGILFFTVQDFEQGRLDELREVGRSALAPLVNKQGDFLSSPISPKDAEKLLSSTLVQGISIYGLGRDLLKVYGSQTALSLLSNDSYGRKTTYRSVNKDSYEVVYAPVDLRRPYFIVAKLDASEVQPLVVGHIKQTVMIVLLMSGFVTSVLMLVLGQWLLEPILLLRNNLLNAANNPESPKLYKLNKEVNDEIGVAIGIANDLIKQNASNLVRLRTQAEDKIHRLAYYDNLTNLPNRAFFVEKLEETIEEHIIGNDRRLVVMTVDLDHFKDINDSMGHDIGDRLLEAVGQRLINATGENAMVARASADEFTIMAFIDEDEDNIDSAAIVENIFTSLGEPITILQEQFQIRASIGVANCPEDGIEASMVMKNADIALNRAKEEGRDTVRYYSADFDLVVKQRFQMLRDLRNALDEEELMLYYHPQFDLKTGNMIGVEALLRWRRPDNSRDGGTFISPEEFIPIAEQSGLIVPIGEWVLKSACRTNKKWQEMGLPPFRVAVNLSGVQFHRGDIVTMVAETLEETGLDPRWLELEVTESVFMEDMTTTISILNQLHALGVEIAIDDFGTGYSSLSYLRQFPIDRLKIDQSFTRNALINKDDLAITKTIISLGHSLGLKVIAEGVETKEHEDFLSREGCDEVQGFKYSKPVPSDLLWEFVQNYGSDLKMPLPNKK